MLSPKYNKSKLIIICDFKVTFSEETDVDNFPIFGKLCSPNNSLVITHKWALPIIRH